MGSEIALGVKEGEFSSSLARAQYHQNGHNDIFVFHKSSASNAHFCTVS